MVGIADADLNVIVPAFRANLSVFRSNLSVAVLSAALAVGMSGPAVTGVVHPTCAAKHHDCAAQVRLTRCCCGDHADLTNQSNLPPSQNDVVGDELGAPLCLFGTVDISVVRAGLGRPEASPPLAQSPDLTILLSDLRL